jgi:hypothetical protein
MADPKKTEQTIETVVVIIAVDNHEHNGIIIPKGTKLDVSPATAEWMRQQHIIEG